MRSAVTLDEIANDVCVGLGDTHFNHKLTVTRKLIDCYRDFSLYIGTEIVVKTEVLNVANVINLPKDFIYETKIGVMHNGIIAILTLDRNQVGEKLNDTDCISYLNNIWSGNPCDLGYYFYNCPNTYGELYGLGRGIVNMGTYNINRRDGILEIGSNIPKDAKIVIEYKSDSIANEGLKLVPTEAKKMHEDYAYKEMYLESKFSNITKAQIYQNRYESSYTKVKRLYSLSDHNKVIDSINAAFSPTNY